MTEADRFRLHLTRELGLPVPLVELFLPVMGRTLTPELARALVKPYWRSVYGMVVAEANRLGLSPAAFLARFESLDLTAKQVAARLHPVNGPTDDAIIVAMADFVFHRLAHYYQEFRCA